jgi:hypothetical protein
MKASQESSSLSIRRVQVYHAAHPCQAASLSLTRSRLRGQQLARLIEAEKTVLFFRCWAAALCFFDRAPCLGGRTSVCVLSGLEGRRLITFVLEPHRVE